MQNVFLPFAPRDRADLKHFRTRTASSRTRAVMPVVPDREVATVIMLGVQFVQLAHAYLEWRRASQSQLPADGFSSQDPLELQIARLSWALDCISHAQRAKRRRPRSVTRGGRYDDEVDEDGRPLKGMKRSTLDYHHLPGEVSAHDACSFESGCRLSPLTSRPHPSPLHPSAASYASSKHARRSTSASVTAPTTSPFASPPRARRAAAASATNASPPQSSATNA
jgi:hypothetical protein